MNTAHEAINPFHEFFIDIALISIQIVSRFILHRHCADSIQVTF